MHKVSTKRQITLPKNICDRLNIESGDFVEIFEHSGNITLIKKEQGRSKGSLQHLKPRVAISDDESLQDAISAS